MQSNNYQLLKDVYTAINRIEDKMDTRIGDLEKRMDKTEDFQSNLTGKITVLGGVMLLVVNFIWDIGKSFLKRLT